MSFIPRTKLISYTHLSKKTIQYISFGIGDIGGKKIISGKPVLLPILLSTELF